MTFSYIYTHLLESLLFSFSPIAAGVEEVSTIALLQSLLTESNAKAKLIPIIGIEWKTQTFHNDPERLKWHEEKMKSKIERPAQHLKLLSSITGTVEHYYYYA